MNDAGTIRHPGLAYIVEQLGHPVFFTGTTISTRRRTGERAAG